MNFDVVKPLLTNAASKAEAPGILITSKLFSITLLTNNSPGSLISGVPASETKAIDFFEFNSFIKNGIFCEKLFL